MATWIIGGIFLIMTCVKLKALIAPTERQREQREQRYGASQQLRTLDSVQQIADIIAHLLLGLGLTTSSWQNALGAGDGRGRIDLTLVLMIGAGICYAISLGLLAYLRRKAPPAGAPGGLAQMLEQITYRSITPEQINPAADHRLPALNAELEALGFRPLGAIEVQAVMGHDIEQEVTELFASPDGSTFAEPERFFSSDTLCLRTLFDDGTIIETTLLLVDPPHSERRIVKMWPRKTLPRAGYMVELRTTGTVRELWEAHRTRISTHTRTSGHTPLVHTRTELYFQLCRQGLELAAQRRATEIIFSVLTLIVVILILLFSSLFSPSLSIGILGLWKLMLLAILLATLMVFGLRFIPRLLNREQLRMVARMISG